MEGLVFTDVVINIVIFSVMIGVLCLLERLEKLEKMVKKEK